MSEQKGSFGIQGTGDTSGYGGLVRSSFSPTSAQKPYGSYFDEVTDELERAFPEFLPYLGNCKFYNCHHHAEPNCAVTAAIKTGEISAMRHDLFKQLVHEAAQTIGY